MKSHSFTLFEKAIKSEASRTVYTYSLHEFMKFSKIKKYDVLAKVNTDKIKKLLKDWVISLSEKGLKATSIRSKLSAVELFLDMNEVTYPKKILHKLIPSDDYVVGGDVPYTTEEIQKMLSATTKPRTKAIIHFFASTGARPATIVDPVLKLKHLKEMSDGRMGIKLYDGSKQAYWAFLTPEATNALKQYHDSRKLNEENLTPESPVFANFPKSSWIKKYDHMSVKAIREVISHILKAAGIERKKDGNRYDKAIVYGFRKRFDTILKLDNNVNSNIAEKLMAHRRGLDGAYLKPTIDECFNEFIKAIPQLTISDEARDKLKIKKLEVEKTEIEKLKIELQDFRDMVNTIDKRIVFESDPVTGEVPFELPDIPRYSKYRLQQQISKDPATYGHLRSLLK